jgi:hypothetical protein
MIESRDAVASQKPILNRRIILASAGLVWTVVVVALYYVTHKPFTLAMAHSLGEALWQITISAAVVSLAGGLGTRILPALALSPLARLSLRAALGLGLSGIGVLVVGSTLGVNTLLSGAALLLGGLLLRRSIRTWWSDLADLLRVWRQAGLFGKLVALGAAGILLGTLLAALAPALKWDALVYHLLLPRIYLQAGRIQYDPQLIFWGMPQLVEMLFTWSTALAGQGAASVLGWFLGVLALVGTLGYTRQRFGQRASWGAVAALLSGFTLASSLSWAYVDWMALYFGWAALVALIEWRLNSGASFLILAGTFTGLALGVKYTTGVLAIAGAFVIVWHFYRQRERWSPARMRAVAVSLAGFAFPLVLFALPWLLKNFFAVGNPVYPFFLPAGAMDRFRLDFYPIPALVNAAGVLLLPWQATMQGVEGSPGFGASIGPLLLAFAPLAWLGFSSRSKPLPTGISTAGILALVGILVWMAGSTLSGYLLQSRLYFVIFPALALLAGVGFTFLSELTLGQVRFYRLAGILILLPLILNSLQVGAKTVGQGALSFVLGSGSRQDYLQANLGWYALAMQAVNELPEDSAVLMLWEARGLECYPKCIPDEIIDRWLHDLHLYGGPERVLNAWRDQDFTHLLYYRTGANYVREQDRRYTPQDWAALDQLLARLPVSSDFDGAYVLYSLEP